MSSFGGMKNPFQRKDAKHREKGITTALNPTKFLFGGTADDFERSYQYSWEYALIFKHDSAIAEAKTQQFDGIDVSESKRNMIEGASSDQFDGEHYVLPRPGGEGKPIRLSQPPRPNLPIYLATLGPKSLQMTGELADGWLGTSFVPEQSHVFLDDLREGAAKAGRSLADIDIQTGGYFEMSDDVERLIAARKPAMAFTLGGMGSAKTNFYNDAYCRAGYEDDAKAVQSLWIDGKRDQAVARVPDEMVLLTNLIGTEDMIRERLKAFRDAGVNTFRLGTGGVSWKERTAALEEAVDLIQRETTSW